MKELKKAKLNEFVEMTDKEMKLVVGGSGSSGSGNESPSGGDSSGSDCGSKSKSDCPGNDCSIDGHTGSCTWVTAESTCKCAAAYYDPD